MNDNIQKEELTIDDYLNVIKGKNKILDILESNNTNFNELSLSNSLNYSKSPLFENDTLDRSRKIEENLKFNNDDINSLPYFDTLPTVIKFPSIENTEQNKSLISLFRPEFSNYLDEKGNNLPMIAIEYKQDELAKELIATRMFDVNHENNNYETIFYFSMKHELIDLCIQLISVYGYNKFDKLLNDKNIANLCIERAKYRPLLPYLINSKCSKETPKKLKIYEDDYFILDKELGKGGYGKVSSAKGKDGKIYALKLPNNVIGNSIPDDFFKEMIISRLINEKYPKTMGEIYGYYPQLKALVIEYLPLTLRNIAETYEDIEIEYKKDFILTLFKKIIENVANINACGFCHFDLKFENIMVDEKCHVRIIDLGLCGFMGLEKISIDDFYQTYTIKGPDDSTKKSRFFHRDQEIFIKQKSESYKVNYSTDMYAIASLILGMVFGKKHPFQLLMLNEKTYVYYKSNETDNIDLQDITKAFNIVCNKFSPHLYDFFVRCFTTDSTIRYTTLQALKHPLFTNDIKSLVPELPYSVTEIDMNSFFVINENDLILRQNSMSFLDEFSNTYTNIQIKSTINNAFKYITQIDDGKIESIMKNNDFDYFLNFYNYFHQINNFNNTDKNEIDIKNELNDLGKIAYKNAYETLISNRSYDIKIDSNLLDNFVNQDIKYIPFTSIIVSYISYSRIAGKSPNKIVNFIRTVSRELLIKFSSEIEEEFILDDFIKAIYQHTIN